MLGALIKLPVMDKPHCSKRIHLSEKLAPAETEVRLQWTAARDRLIAKPLRRGRRDYSG